MGPMKQSRRFPAARIWGGREAAPREPVMIPLPAFPAHPDRPPELRAPDWRRQWREAVRDPRELLSLLGLEARAPAISEAAAAAFPLRVPRAFVARMRHGDAADPLLR